ncbi:hypothetical protein D3C72_1166010 [compost metagenome]
MNGPGRSCPRAHTEPNAQPTGAISSSTSPVGEAVRLLPALSQTTPTKPTAMPSHSPLLACWPRRAENNAIHSGTEATAVAARPDDTSRSASTTMPLPSTSMVTPMMARLRHCRRVGFGIFQNRRNARYITPPAMMNRLPETIVSGSAPPCRALAIPR